MDDAAHHLRQRCGVCCPPRSVVPGAVAVARAADRRAAVFAHTEARTSATGFDAFDLDAAWIAAKGVARAALGIGAADAVTLREASVWPAIERDLAAANVVLRDIIRVDARRDGLLATSTGPDGKSAVVVEVNAPHRSPRIVYFADWLALRANLNGIDFLRCADVPDNAGWWCGALEDLWSGSFGTTAGAYERRLAEEFAGFAVLRLLRVSVRPR